MSGQLPQLETSRLRLRCWRVSDRDDFAEMNADLEVMHDLGTLSRSESDRKLDRFAAAFDRFGFSRWVIEDLKGRFLGYTGVLPSRDEHPLGSHDEIGWRLVRPAWGNGYATEAARAALDDAFIRVGLKEIIAYTSPDNFQSQAVMARLKLQRDASRDFTHYDGVANWDGLVWVALPPPVVL
jgi:RimJ/RimL family protein N-acetyltransferase